MFYINNKDKSCMELVKYEFDRETTFQEILSNNPSILLTINDLEIPPYDSAISIREFPTARGPIDIVYFTDNGDIILVETKLLRNSDAHRTVVAQAIDYAKAFSLVTLSEIKKKIMVNKKDSALLESKRNIDLVINKNLQAGNFHVLIVGDEVHSNILGMIESIQSAPHLSFTLSAISLNPHTHNDNLILFPKIEVRSLSGLRPMIFLFWRKW